VRKTTKESAGCTLHSGQASSPLHQHPDAAETLKFSGTCGAEDESRGVSAQRCENFACKSFLFFSNYLWLDMRGFLFHASGRMRRRKNAGILNS